jgi:hypothetical protein
VKASMFLATTVTMDGPAERNHFHRLDVLMASLLSWSQVPWENVHLHIGLQLPFWAPRLEAHAKLLFGDRLKTLSFKALTTVEEWTTAIDAAFPKEGFDENYPVLVSASDEHFFLDEANEVIMEAFEIVGRPKRGPWRHASLGHYQLNLANFLRTVCKGTSARVDTSSGWIGGVLNAISSVHLSNLGLVRKLLASNLLPVAVDNSVSAPSASGAVFSQFRQFVPPTSIAVEGLPSFIQFFLPLKEMTRKASGYVEVGIPSSLVPDVRLPLEDNFWPMDAKFLVHRSFPPTYMGWIQKLNLTTMPECPPPPKPTNGPLFLPAAVALAKRQITTWLLSLTRFDTGTPFERFRDMLNATSPFLDSVEEVNAALLEHNKKQKTLYTTAISLEIPLLQVPDLLSQPQLLQAAPDQFGDFSVLRDVTSTVKATLLISTYVTRDRPPAKNMLHRVDVFLTTLMTWAQIPWEQVHMFVSLEDPSWQGKVEAVARALFGNRLKTLQFQRIVLTADWRATMSALFPADQYDDNYPIFISSNDDHPFVDENMDAMLEALELIRDPSSGPWRMAYVIHLPEMAQFFSSCGKNFSRAGKYWVSGTWNVFDGTELANLGLLRNHFFNPISHWVSITELKRVDGGPGTNTDKLPGSEHPPRFFLPLKEQTRKTIGYSFHPGISHKSVPYIRCPLEENVWDTTPEARLYRMVPPETWTTGWTTQCPPRPIPDEWTGALLELTANYTGKPFEKFRGMYKCDGFPREAASYAKAFLTRYVAQQRLKYSGGYVIDFLEL